MPVTAFCAAFLAPLYMLLSARVIIMRRRVRTPLGNRGNVELLRRTRVHANFSEYVPFALILLAAAESLSAPTVLLAAGGTLLLAGRYVHAYGVAKTVEDFRVRMAGMVMTITAIFLLACTCLWTAASQFM